jgi:hypothetical protein
MAYSLGRSHTRSASGQLKTRRRQSLQKGGSDLLKVPLCANRRRSDDPHACPDADASLGRGATSATETAAKWQVLGVEDLRSCQGWIVPRC